MSKDFKFDPHLNPRLLWTGKADQLDILQLPCIPYEVFSPAIIFNHWWGNIEADGSNSHISLRVLRKKSIKTYKSDPKSPNRLILGDSLLVLNSLAFEDNLKGQVQMIYVDPPYGIGFNAKILTDTSKTEMSENVEDYSDSVKNDQVKAYHDNWNLGTHSYLTFLHDRLLVASFLLHPSGSIFVQIGIDNFHYVRIILDEIFGAENFVNIISFQKTGSTGGKNLPIVNDFIIWYAKSKSQMKYHQLFLKKDVGHDSIKTFSKVEFPDGTRRNLTAEEKRNPRSIPEGGKLFKTISLHSQHHSKTRSFPFKYQGIAYPCPKDRQWSVSETGLKVLAEKNRIYNEGKSILYIYYLDDFPLVPLSNLWIDARGDMKMRYNVQTAEKIIERCMLMTTDPGDLVVDPTCGSGTTAYIAEKWARRWITCDISRMAVNITRSRLLSAVFAYYKQNLDPRTHKPQFIYKKYPHISASTIAYSKDPEYEVLYDEPEVDSSFLRITNPFQLEIICSPKNLKNRREKANIIEDKNETNIYQQKILNLLISSGIWYPNGKHISLIDIKASESSNLHAYGSVKSGSNKENVGIYIGQKYDLIHFSDLEHAIEESKNAGLSILLIIGSQFNIDVQTQLQKSVNSDLYCQLVCVNSDIILEDCDSIPEDMQLFTILGTPLVDLVENGSGLQLQLRGMEIFSLDTKSTETIPPEQLSLWSIDENYNQIPFIPNQCLFPSKNRAAQAFFKNWQKWIDKSQQNLVIGTISKLFNRPKTKKIAVKVIDALGYESVKIIDT